MNRLEQQIADLEQKLQAQDAERETLSQTLAQLKQQHHQQQQNFAQRITEAAVNHQSSRQDKINLFRKLFKGHEDVYPKRFESSKTGKTGYTPVCLNDKFAWWANLHDEAARRARGMDVPSDWHPKLWHKPRIKCSDCRFRAYQPVTDVVIANHLMGIGNPAMPHENYVIGVYPPVAG